MHGTVGQPQPLQAAPSPAPQGATDEVQFDLRKILGVLRRHKWLILMSMLVLNVLIVLLTLQLRQQFTATALVVVDSRDSQLLGFAPDITDGISANNLVDTEVVIARSTRVLERAAAALDLGTWPDFAASPTLTEMLRALVGINQLDAPAMNPLPFSELSVVERARIVEELSKRIRVRRDGLTSVISISATAYDAESAAHIANMIADAYLLEQISARLGSNERSAAFLRSRVDNLALDISALEDQIDRFVADKLAELGSPEIQQLLAVIEQQSESRRADARALSDLQAALQGDDRARLSQLLAAENAEVAIRRASVAAEIAAARDDVTLAEAHRRLDALDTEIREAATGRTNALQTQIALADARSIDARQQISNTLSQLDLPRDVSVELYRLQRDAETSRSLYQSYLTKLRQLEQQSDFSIPDSRIIASATPPTQPSFPPRRIILAGSLLLSFMFGVGLAFLREHLVGGVTSVEQLENLTGLPVVAAIPRYTGGRSSHPEAAILTQPLSAFSEAIRRTRLGIEAHKTAKVILITSALPGDGKTTLAIALTRLFASTGSKTLLIDADLRHPAVHHFLGERVRNGLIGFLAEDSTSAPDKLSVIREKETGAYFLFGAQDSSIATDALLMSSRFQALVSFAREHYDVVLVDTPPVGLVVDATLVARHCDLGVFVVRYAVTGQTVLRNALRELTSRIEIPVVGVLNAVEKADSYQYGYGNRYRDYHKNG